MTFLYITALSGIEALVIWLFLTICSIILCVKRAKKVNRNKIVWGILGFLFSFMALLVLYLLPKLEEE